MTTDKWLITHVHQLPGHTPTTTTDEIPESEVLENIYAAIRLGWWIRVTLDRVIKIDTPDRQQQWVIRRLKRTG